VRLELVDYHFELVGELKSGPQVIRIETPGPSMHEADLFRLEDGRTIEDLRRWRKDGRRGSLARALGDPSGRVGTDAASVGAAVAAFDRGAAIFRAHDVAAHVEALAAAAAVERGSVA